MRPCAALALCGWPGVAEKLRRAVRNSRLAIERAAHHACVARGGLREAHLPTEQPSSCQEARLPPPDEHPRRPSRAEGTPRQGPPQAVGLIWRIRERSAFARLASRGPASPGRSAVVHLHPRSSASPRRRGWPLPSVAPRTGRRSQSCAPPACGPCCSRRRPIGLPPGRYLFGAQPAAARRSFVELAVRSGSDSCASRSRLIRPGHRAINGRSKAGRRRAGSRPSCSALRRSRRSRPTAPPVACGSRCVVSCAAVRSARPAGTRSPAATITRRTSTRKEIAVT